MNNYQQTSQGTTEQIEVGTIHHNLSDLMPASSESGHIWNAYLAESISVCYLKKWVREATDPEIYLTLQQVLDASTQRVLSMENIFNSINYPIPEGFGEKDVDADAPQLFSQTFTCLFTRMMQKIILHHYISGATSSYRSDFRDFYSECIKVSEQLHRRLTEILLAKGLLHKHPSITTPRSIGNVTGKGYFGSYIEFFGDKRPLNAIEVGHIYTMMEIMQLIRTLTQGQSQIVKSEKIKNYLFKAVKMNRSLSSRQMKNENRFYWTPSNGVQFFMLRFRAIGGNSSVTFCLTSFADVRSCKSICSSQWLLPGCHNP